MFPLEGKSNIYFQIQDSSFELMGASCFVYFLQLIASIILNYIYTRARAHNSYHADRSLAGEHECFNICMKRRFPQTLVESKTRFERSNLLRFVRHNVTKLQFRIIASCNRVYSMLILVINIMPLILIYNVLTY